jgi:heterodisulfide reductase subunit A-like polyferredoxin
MYAIKEAVIAREHEPDVDATIFYMDIRSFGKEFERYYERARTDYGVRFLRGRVSHVSVGLGNRLALSYEGETGNIATEEFDLVVLSVGLHGEGPLRELGERLGVPINEFGFVASDPLHSVRTLKEGVFVCGPAQEPKDIPESVTQASAAAAAAAELLSANRFRDVSVKEYPEERFIAGLCPRVGVFICNCGINIGGVVDVPDLTEYAGRLPNVVHAESNLYTCSQDTQTRIRDLIDEHELNRIVVASCTPRTHQPLFQDTIRDAGLNPYVFEMANIRDQCSWVHRNQPARATEKARDLVRMAVAKVARLEPLPTVFVEVTPSALVIGGGPAGMASALSLARQGFPVHLVERSDRLGGMLHTVRATHDGRDTASILAQMTAEVGAEKLITVHLSAAVNKAEGFVGNFETTVTDEHGGQAVIRHGATIVATGARESSPAEYRYGSDARVMTGLEFEDYLESRPPRSRPLSHVVFIQCVGSREPEHNYCSRTCCTGAIKNALRLKKSSPDTEVSILYRDIRSYGFSEHLYREARERGVIFVRFDEDDKPSVTSADEGLHVTVVDAMSAAELSITADLVVLASRVDPLEDNEDLSRLLRVPLNQDGFFMEAHAKLRPVDFAGDGIYLAGTAHAPKSIPESITRGARAEQEDAGDGGHCRTR